MKLWHHDARLDEGTMYQPEGIGNFTDYVTTGSEAWRLVVIDDSEGGVGSFDSFQLRGHGHPIPEPTTLLLLAVSLICVLCRRHL